MTNASQPASPDRLETAAGQSLAYHRSPGRAPGVVFLGGYASDMSGTKATALETHVRDRGHAFLRFDYRGHGQSSGRFDDGTIGRWRDDALAAFDALTEGPQILVGRSEEHTPELQSLMRISYAVFCLKKKNTRLHR